jgi:hypothetical protein
MWASILLFKLNLNNMWEYIYKIMFLSLEKELLLKNFNEIKNGLGEIIYADEKDARKQVIIRFHMPLNKWSFSFPLKDDDFNYLTYWKDVGKLKPYALGRIATL